MNETENMKQNSIKEGIPIYKPIFKIKRIKIKETIPKHIISKKIIPQKLSKEYVFRPCIKPVKSYLQSIKNKIRVLNTRRHFEQKPTFDDIFGKKILNYSSRNIKPKDCLTSGCTVLPNILSEQKKNFLSNSQITATSLAEINIEKIMNPKRRVFSLEQKRNFIKFRNPGDKNYRYVEETENFFKEGGLIVGSTNRFRRVNDFQKIKNNIYSTLDLRFKSLQPKKLWKYKIEKENEKNEYDYVNKLEEWEKEYLIRGGNYVK